MFEVTKSGAPGLPAPIGQYATKAEAEAAVYAAIEKAVGKDYGLYAEDDPDYPGCADFFAWSKVGGMSVVLSINAKETTQ